MFCCNGLAHRIENAGERGLSILVRNTDEGIRFVLQSRGVSFPDQDKVGVMTVDLNVSTDFGLRFCPFCGQKLEELAQTDMAMFDGLAKAHRVFLSS